MLEWEVKDRKSFNEILEMMKEMGVFPKRYNIYLNEGEGTAMPHQFQPMPHMASIKLESSQISDLE